MEQAKQSFESLHDATVLHTITLGQHDLLLKSDQSIEMMHSEAVPNDTKYVFSLDRCEAYRLMICLQELFKEANV